MANAAWLVAAIGYFVVCILHVGEAIAVPGAVLIALGVAVTVARRWVPGPHVANETENLMERQNG